jgi:hypothetical protein
MWEDSLLDLSIDKGGWYKLPVDIPTSMR